MIFNQKSVIFFKSVCKDMIIFELKKKVL